MKKVKRICLRCYKRLGALLFMLKPFVRRFNPYIKLLRKDLYSLRQYVRILLCKFTQQKQCFMRYCFYNRHYIIRNAMLGVCYALGSLSLFEFGVLWSESHAYCQEIQCAQSQEPPPIVNEESKPLDSSVPIIGDSLRALDSGMPIMPRPDESESIITGNLTFNNAISIAKSALDTLDFSRARIWIFRAYGLHNDSQEVWELYWRSWNEDKSAKYTQKQEAYVLYLQAKRYYGF